MLFELFRSKPKESPPGYDELDDRVSHVERQVKMLEMEWESVYNKIRSVLARLNKREERAALEAPVPENGGTPVGDDLDRLIALRRGRR